MLLAVWHSGNVIGNINKVTVHWACVGCMTIFQSVYHLGM